MVWTKPGPLHLLHPDALPPDADLPTVGPKTFVLILRAQTNLLFVAAVRVMMVRAGVRERTTATVAAQAAAF